MLQRKTKLIFADNVFYSARKRLFTQTIHGSRSHSKHQPQHQFLSNIEATKLLKDLYKNREKSLNANDRKLIMQKAIQIYRNINEERNHYSINTFLNVCIFTKHYNEGTKLWKEIKCVKKMSQALVLKCYVLYARFDKNEFIQCLNIVKYMKSTKYISKNRKTDSIDYSVSISTLISRCNNNLERIERIHALIDENNDIFIKTALINAYGKCRAPDKLMNVFLSILKKDTVSMNAAMSGLNDNDCYKQSIGIYQQFESLHHETSHLLALQSCANLCDLELGKFIHSKLDFDALTDSKMRIKFVTTLIDLYGNCLDMENVLKIYSKVSDNEKDIVLLSALMEAYFHNNWNKECLQLFANLREINSNLRADTVCYAIALKACTQATAYHFGQRIHCELRQNEYLSWMLHETEIQINLIELYGKCGHLDICQRIFDEIKQNEREKYLKCVNLCNAMIHSHARNGNLDNVFCIFSDMKTDGVNTDKNTFILLISACAHCGDLNKAKNVWQEIEDYNIKYDMYLISSLVDCYARCGYLKEGMNVILEYESYSKGKYYEAMWTSLMSGCTKYGNTEIGEVIVEEMNKRFDMKQARHLAASSIMLSNIYGAANDFDKKNEIRAEMKRKGLDKYQRIGKSEIDIYGTVHSFVAGNYYRKNREYDGIDAKLDELVSKMKRDYGYEPDVRLITRELNAFKNETHESVLLRHSEKIAVVYGLLQTSQEYEIVINKNLRICTDCHNFMKLVSQIEGRKLVISDSNRVHIFINGACNCNDFY